MQIFLFIFLTRPYPKCVLSGNPWIIEKAFFLKKKNCQYIVRPLYTDCELWPTRPRWLLLDIGRNWYKLNRGVSSWLVMQKIGCFFQIPWIVYRPLRHGVRIWSGNAWMALQRLTVSSERSCAIFECFIHCKNSYNLIKRFLLSLTFFSTENFDHLTTLTLAGGCCFSFSRPSAAARYWGSSSCGLFLGGRANTAHTSSPCLIRQGGPRAFALTTQVIFE